MGQRIQVVIIAIVTMVNAVSCLASSVSDGRKEKQERQASPISPAPWEEKKGELYASRGISHVEKVGARYLLTTFCAGSHSVYAQGGEGIHLDDYLEGFVRVHFTYALVTNPNIRCVQAPCTPVTEQVAVIKRLERVSVSEAERLSYQRTCTADAPP